MASKSNPQTGSQAALPADDPQRKLAVTRTESGRHIGVVGDTYTILVTGKDTAGRFCLVECSFRREAGRRRIATTSKKPSASSRANSN